VTNRALIQLDAGWATVRRDRRFRSPTLWSGATSSEPADALNEVLASVAILGHGRRADIDVVLETPRAVLLQPRSQSPTPLERQESADLELRAVGLRPDEVVVRWIPDDLRANVDGVASQRLHHVLLAVAREVIDPVEAVLRQRRCAGRVGLDLGVLRRFRPLLASHTPERRSSAIIFVDVTRAALNVAVAIDGRLRSCRAAAVGHDPERSVIQMLGEALEDVPVGSRPSVGHPAARPLECVLLGADRSSPLGRACVELLEGGEILHHVRAPGRGAVGRARRRALEVVR
jgi:hypothetical protein